MEGTHSPSHPAPGHERQQSARNPRCDVVGLHCVAPGRRLENVPGKSFKSSGAWNEIMATEVSNQVGKCESVACVETAVLIGCSSLN